MTANHRPFIGVESKSIQDGRDAMTADRRLLIDVESKSI